MTGIKQKLIKEHDFSYHFYFLEKTVFLLFKKNSQSLGFYTYFIFYT